MNENKTIKTMFKMLDEDKLLAIDLFYIEHLNKPYYEFKSSDEIDLNLNLKELTSEESELLRIYSGYNYKNINNILRDRWNYEENGNINKKEELLDVANGIKKVLDNNQQSIGNRLAFRGATIDYFKDYGVESLNDLENLKNTFLIDKSFISTSLIEDKCFYKKENELGNNYNIKIIYMIPEEFEDGIYIGNSNTSYNKEQCEYLINSWNIAKISDVYISEDSAIIKALLIPKKVYDNYYNNDLNKENII